MELYLEDQISKYKNILDKPRIGIFLMGIPGSGKSTVVKQFIENLLGILLYHIYISNSEYSYTMNNFININPDEIVKTLPEYEENDTHKFLGIGARLSNKVFNNIMEEGKHNFIYDGTGKQFGTYLKKIQKAQETKYFTILLDVKADLLKCYQRMVNRKRKVNNSTIERLFYDIYTPKNYSKENIYQDMNNYDILESVSDISIVLNNNENSYIESITGLEKEIHTELKDFIKVSV